VKRLLALATVPALLALGGCTSSGGGPLPSGRELLRRAAASMRTVQSGRFSLEVKGQIGGLEVRSAEGVMTRSGEASGTVELEQAGQLVEFDVVYVRGTVYVRGPTGPFQTVPPVVAGTIYDPTELLSPSGGLVKLLATARKAKTTGTESVGGPDAYRVRATLDGKVLGPLVPNPVPPSVAATMWIGTGEPRLLRTETSFPATGSSGATSVTLGISEYNLSVHITPPPTS
jgi:lipoprotein LprG